MIKFLGFSDLSPDILKNFLETQLESFEGGIKDISQLASEILKDIPTFTNLLREFLLDPEEK